MKFKSRFSSVERSEIVRKSQQCLWSNSGTPGLDYLRNERCLSDDVIKRFGLGYLPMDLRHQLAGRIIMPLHDASGNLVTVTSRAVGKGRYDLPVYWHENYEKRFYLYGINHAKTSMRSWRFVVLVEGQFDVLQLHNHGLTNVVGVCSHNVHDMQIAIARRYCNEIVLLFDNDENRAGQSGTEKVMERTKKRNYTKPDYMCHFRNVQKIVPVFLESGDPDEFVRRFGINALKQKIKLKLQKMRQEYGG